MSVSSCEIARAAALCLGLSALTGGAVAQSTDVQEVRRAEYDAVQPKSVIELQMFRDTAEAVLPGDPGRHLRFISLNPRVNAWFLLQTGTAEKPAQESYHIENPDPAGQAVGFAAGGDPALELTRGGETFACRPWEGDPAPLAAARDKGIPYAPICDGRLYLRNKASGSRTALEATTEFLRDHVWGGERILNLAKDTLFKDSEMETAEVLGMADEGRAAVGPGAAAILETLDARPVIGHQMDISVHGAEPGRMAAGLWYPVKGLKGVYAGAYQPRWVPKAIHDGPGTASWLDSVESRANGYFVAFDLSAFDLGFAVGTDHPGVGWSDRPPYSVRPRGLTGPDGFNTVAPLVRLGMVNPDVADRVVATFTAGFKRPHGAFKYGDYREVDYGKHYGFIENGAVLSKLWPKLSTLYVLDDGTVGMKTWEEEDSALLPRIRFARQNGVPLVVTDPETGLPVPGDRVTQWGPGNWSGSAEAKLRTLRAGACMKRHEGRDYLIYGYFSTATPSAMARTFQAYGCNYAMLLDMNALEHTYLALYARNEDGMHVQHLVPGMGLIEKKARDGNLILRFLGFVDNRDFFYLTPKEDGT